MLACRMIGTRGVSKGSFGHVSARIPGTDVCSSSLRGPTKRRSNLPPSATSSPSICRARCCEAPDGLNAPAETAMHTAIYRARPEVMSVIHSHPLWVVVLTACDKPLVGLYGAYDGANALRLLEEGLPTYPGTQTIINDELAQDFLTRDGQPAGVLAARTWHDRCWRERRGSHGHQPDRTRAGAHELPGVRRRRAGRRCRTSTSTARGGPRPRPAARRCDQRIRASRSSGATARSYSTQSRSSPAHAARAGFHAS